MPNGYSKKILGYHKYMKEAAYSPDIEIISLHKGWNPDMGWFRP